LGLFERVNAPALSAQDDEYDVDPAQLSTITLITLSILGILAYIFFLSSSQIILIIPEMTDTHVSNLGRPILEWFGYEGADWKSKIRICSRIKIDSKNLAYKNTKIYKNETD